MTVNMNHDGPLSPGEPGLSDDPRTSRKPGTVAVIIVGDEILDGHTLDTNSHWLAQKLTAAGYHVRERLVVRDGIHEISRALDLCMSPPPDVLFLCGGIGPTPDDVTFEAVARYLGVELLESEEALENLKLRYRSLNRKISDRKYVDGGKIELNEAARKMARIPDGSIILRNMKGTAPGLMIQMDGGTRLFVLPGVPGEFKWIVERSILGTHLEIMEPKHIEEVVVREREASFAPTLERLGNIYPGISIGSYPQDDHTIIIRMSGKKKTVKAAARELENIVRTRQ